jgi:Tat protein translocase TatB subunit
MLSLGIGELVVIGAVLVIFVGPERLPHVMRWAGRSYGQVRRAADDMRRAFVLEADRQDAEERYAKLLEERKRLRAERDAALQAQMDAGGADPADHGPVAYDDPLPPPAEPAPDAPKPHDEASG